MNFLLLFFQLSDEVIVDAVTLEHIPKELSSTGNVNSAPADFSVWVN